ncbi:putative uncharacterized protein [Burkholderiales bacterium GJ-E10]|nr:putative uncharacterized protein [Burkholderiales bacterium GJ-E10]
MSADRAEEVFASLQAEAVRFAKDSTLSVEDVRQELYLMCLEHAAGADGFDPGQGDARRFIAGRLWGLTERWRRMESIPDDDGLWNGPLRASVEEALIERQERAAAEERLEQADRQRQRDLRNLPTLAALVAVGAVSERGAARLVGSKSSRLRQRLRQLRKQEDVAVHFR